MSTKDKKLSNALILIIPCVLGDDCFFPGTWHGDWFLQGENNLVNITKQDFGNKGFCYAKACDVCEQSSDYGGTWGQSWEDTPKSDGLANDGKRYVIYNR